MAHRAELKISGELERIPPGNADSPAFVEWCETNDVTPLGEEYGNRRGWWYAQDTYIGDAGYVFYADTLGMLLLTQAQLDEMLIKED